jgi:ATP-binding protein involved in chromosome partitioning
VNRTHEVKKAKMMLDERLRKINENLSRAGHRIAVISGKGGVGKTTVAVNLAALLAEKGAVALLDADIDCPNVNGFLGIHDGLLAEGKKILPKRKYNMSVVSFASFLQREDQPVIWRGPMLSNAVMQLLEQVEWGKQDYLIADLPPGTGDVAITIMQMMKPDGVIIVTTPQAVAKTDAKKAANMALELGVQVLGVVENMSGAVFGTGGGQRLALELGVAFLGRLQLDRQISSSSEKGKPFVLTEGSPRQEFIYIAERLKKILS